MKKILGLFIMLAILVLGGVASAQSTSPTNSTKVLKDIEITKVKINGDPITGTSTILSLERGEDLEITVYLTAHKDMKNVDLKAFITGYEYGDNDEISDSTGTFDMEKDVNYIKKLKLKLTDLVEEDQYKLRILISDRNTFSDMYNYDIKIDSPKYKLKIIDVITQNKVKAGSSLLATVRVENRGHKDAKNVKVVFSIPQLSLSATEYIEKVKDNDEAETEEMYIKLPKCTKPGIYTAEIDVYYNRGRDKTSTTTQIEVLENEACNKKDEPQIIIVQQKPEQNTQQETTTAQPTTKEETATKSKIRTGLEIILIILVGLLILIGIAIGLSRMRKSEE